MEAKVVKFINDSRKFRGEKLMCVMPNERKSYMIPTAIIFLVIFVTGCVMANNAKPTVIKRQQTTEEPK